MLLVAVWIAFAQDPAQPNLPDPLSRVAEEADMLQQNAPKSLTQEVLEQRALMPATRFRPRIGKKATTMAAPPSRLVVRQIVSEYSVGTLKDSTVQNLTELRQVISVDGRKVQSAASARHALSLGVTSADDRIRKRMLEDFAKHGLVDIATDYGIFLLAFTKRGLAARNRSAPTPPGCSTGSKPRPMPGCSSSLVTRRRAWPSGAGSSCASPMACRFAFNRGRSIPKMLRRFSSNRGRGIPPPRRSATRPRWTTFSPRTGSSRPLPLFTATSSMAM